MIGYTRILGTTHIPWLPMSAWMATRLETIMSQPALANWLLLLFVTNLVSAVVDTTDAVRFIRASGRRTTTGRYRTRPDVTSNNNYVLLLFCSAAV